MTPRRKNAPPTPTDLPCRICQGPGALTSGALNGLPEGVPACGTCREAIKNRQVGVSTEPDGSLSITDGRHEGQHPAAPADVDDAAGAPTHGPGPYCTATYEVYSCTMTEGHQGAHEAIDPDNGEVLAAWDQTVGGIPPEGASSEPDPELTEAALAGEPPSCDEHGVMVADNEHGTHWHCAVCGAFVTVLPESVETGRVAEVTVDLSKPAGEQAAATNDHPMSAIIAQGMDKAMVAPRTVAVLSEDWDRVMLLLGSVEEARSENNDAKEHAAATKKTLEKAQESLERALDRVRSGLSAQQEPRLPFDGPQAPPEPPGTPEPSPDGLPFDGVHMADVAQPGSKPAPSFFPPGHFESQREEAGQPSAGVSLSMEEFEDCCKLSVAIFAANGERIAPESIAYWTPELRAERWALLNGVPIEHDAATAAPLRDEDVTGQHIIDDANAALDADEAAENTDGGSGVEMGGPEPTPEH